MTKQLPRLSRRSFLAGTAGTIAAPMLLRASSAAAESKSVAITGYGGSFQEAYNKCVANPFTQETGIKVKFVPKPGLDKIKAMQLTGNVELDVHQCQASEAAFGSKRGFWDKLDPSLFDLNDLSVPPASDAVVEYFYCEGIAWDPKKYGPGKIPASFADLFDAEKFPGRRALRNRPDQTLEEALLADGVAPTDIYPLDLDRAFKSLDRLKPSIAAWTSTVTQTTSLLQTGEVDFSITNTSRVKPTNEPGGGVPLTFSLEQVVLAKAMTVILNGAPNRANAMKFIAYAMRPEVQARFQNEVVLTPASKKAITMLSPDASKWQPDLSNPKNLIINEAYWADNLDAVNQRFRSWVMT